MALKIAQPGAPASSGTSLSIKGSVASNADFYFNGSLEGSILAEQSVVTIGPDARVMGDVNGLSVLVQGTVLGNITAREHVALGNSSRLEGKVVTGRISIEDGAFFKGSVDIGSGLSSRPNSAKQTEESFVTAMQA